VQPNTADKQVFFIDRFYRRTAEFRLAKTPIDVGAQVQA
jgi:hypothetical protein